MKNAENIPVYSGDNYYRGAWAVAEHISQTARYNADSIWRSSNDALVQFTMNERNNFIHGLLSATADARRYLKQSEMKTYAMQWIGTAYEYARTGKVQAIDGLSVEQVECIIKGFVDTYEQETESIRRLQTTLKVGEEEASKEISHRQKRLRALGMVCHTMEDFWCSCHTCRTYKDGGSIPRYTVLAFCNYRKQNGTAGSVMGYHMPFDRYALTDAENATDWRLALTKGIKGTETIDGVLSDQMRDALLNADTRFNTLGMNETITCVTRLFEFMLDDTPWDKGVRQWVDREVLPTYFDGNGQAIVCDAGRRSLHSPTFLIAPVRKLENAFKKVKKLDVYNGLYESVVQYDLYQQWTHEFYTNKYNTNQSKYVAVVPKGKQYCTDEGAYRVLKDFAATLDSFVTDLDGVGRSRFLSVAGSSSCHKMIAMLENVRHLLHEYAIDLMGTDNPDAEAMGHVANCIEFFKSGEKSGSDAVKVQSLGLVDLIAPREAFADEADGTDERYVTTDMEIIDFVCYVDGSYQVSVRDLDSLTTCVMEVPADTPGKDKLVAGASNLKITYMLTKMSEDDIDFRYVVKQIEEPEVDDPIAVVTGDVESVSEGVVTIATDEGDTRHLQIPEDEQDLPEAGTYACAYYTRDEHGAEILLDYIDLERHEDLETADYPVVSVLGSGMWVLDIYDSGPGNEADGAGGGHGGNGHMLYISYGNAQITPIPQEGCMATVTFHNEGIYDAFEDEIKPGYDDSELEPVAVSLMATAEPTGTNAFDPGPDTDLFSTQAADPAEAYDSADKAGYESFDDYWTLYGGNESERVADTIQGSSERVSEELIDALFGGYAVELKEPRQVARPDDPAKPDGPTKPDDLARSDDPATRHYVSNGDGTHRRYTTDPTRYTTEKCTYNSSGECILCGYAYRVQGDVYPAGYEVPWPRNLHPQVYTTRGTGWAPRSNPRYTTSSSGTTHSGSSSTHTASTSYGSADGSAGAFAPDAVATPTAVLASAPTAGVASTPAAGVATGGAQAPATGAATQVGVLPNTGDAIAGIDVLMSAAAAAGAVMASHGVKKATTGQLVEEEDVRES